ncbi:hypothetical protein JOM56_015753 [Amanita muscaria]
MDPIKPRMVGQWSTLLHVEKPDSFLTFGTRPIPNNAGCGAPDGDAQLLTTKILPEFEIIESSQATKIKQHIARIALRILILDRFGVQTNGRFQQSRNEITKRNPLNLQMPVHSIQDPTWQFMIAFVLPLLDQVRAGSLNERNLGNELKVMGMGRPSGKSEAVSS